MQICIQEARIPAPLGRNSAHRVFQTMAAKNGTTGPKPGSLKYAAAKIGCSLPTLYDLIEAGKLRSYHIGRAHRVSDQAITDCITLLEREPSGSAAGQLPVIGRTKRVAA